LRILPSTRIRTDPYRGEKGGGFGMVGGKTPHRRQKSIQGSKSSKRGAQKGGNRKALGGAQTGGTQKTEMGGTSNAKGTNKGKTRRKLKKERKFEEGGNGTREGRQKKAGGGRRGWVRSGRHDRQTEHKKEKRKNQGAGRTFFTREVACTSEKKTGERFPPVTHGGVPWGRGTQGLEG